MVEMQKGSARHRWGGCIEMPIITKETLSTNTKEETDSEQSLSTEEDKN